MQAKFLTIQRKAARKRPSPSGTSFGKISYVDEALIFRDILFGNNKKETLVTYWHSQEKGNPNASLQRKNDPP